MFIFFLAGFIGGTIRGIVGIIKYTLSYKDVKMQWGYFSGTALVSGLIGMTAAWIIQDMGVAFEGVKGLSPAVALIVGYAGGDFLENIFKVFMKKPILFGGEKER
jgi:hypothetical protein